MLLFNILQGVAVISGICAQSASYSYSGGVNTDENLVLPGNRIRGNPGISGNAGSYPYSGASNAYSSGYSNSYSSGYVNSPGVVGTPGPGNWSSLNYPQWPYPGKSIYFQAMKYVYLYDEFYRVDATYKGMSVILCA